MILNKVDSDAHSRGASILSENEFHICKGNYVGVVWHGQNQYEFLVRDNRRECPTIYGSGVDLSHATTAVTELLNALLREP